MAFRHLLSVAVLTACVICRSASGADAVQNDKAAAVANDTSVATESPCKISEEAPGAGSGYFDLRENRFGCWPGESMMNSGPDCSAPSGCPSLPSECPGNCNPCGENPPCDEDWWASPFDRQIVSATVGLTIFRSDFHGGSLSNQSADFAASDDGAFAGITYAPRVLLATQSCEWGLLGRFWYLSDADASFTPLGFNGSAVGLNSTTRTRASTADFEANRRWGFLECGEIDTSIGFRYATFSADGVLSSVKVLGPDVYDSFSGMSTQFSGCGITSGASAHLPLAENAWLCRGCTLSLFGSLRGSVVFGDSDADTTASSRITTGLGNVAVANSDVVRQSSTLYIGEVACGLEWNRRWTCIPADAFFRIAGEYQAWDVTSPGESSSTTSLSAAGQFANASAHASDSGLSLVGVAVTTGFTW